MLTYASMPQGTKRMANSNLGRGVLRSIFVGNHDFNLMLKIEDGELVGFAVYHYETYSSGGRKRTMGVIDCLLVDAPYRLMGYGTELTLTVLKKMAAYGVDRVEALIKKPGFSNRDEAPGVPLANPDSILELLGFKLIKVFHDYYESTSLKYEYHCKFCGDLPDSCKALLYAAESAK